MKNKIDNKQEENIELYAKDIYKDFMLFFDGDYKTASIATLDTFTLGVTKLWYDIKKDTLHVHLRSPGFLIGKEGQTISKLKEYLGCAKIHVHEVVELWDNEKIYSREDMLHALAYGHMKGREGVSHADTLIAYRKEHL